MTARRAAIRIITCFSLRIRRGLVFLASDDFNLRKRMIFRRE